MELKEIKPEEVQVGDILNFDGIGGGLVEVVDVEGDMVFIDDYINEFSKSMFLKSEIKAKIYKVK